MNAYALSTHALQLSIWFFQRLLFFFFFFSTFDHINVPCERVSVEPTLLAGSVLSIDTSSQLEISYFWVLKVDIAAISFLFAYAVFQAAIFIVKIEFSELRGAPRIA